MGFQAADVITVEGPLLGALLDVLAGALVSVGDRLADQIPIRPVRTAPGGRTPPALGGILPFEVAAIPD